MVNVRTCRLREFSFPYDPILLFYPYFPLFHIRYYGFGTIEEAAVTPQPLLPGGTGDFTQC